MASRSLLVLKGDRLLPPPLPPDGEWLRPLLGGGSSFPRRLLAVIMRKRDLIAREPESGKIRLLQGTQQMRQTGRRRLIFGKQQQKRGKAANEMAFWVMECWMIHRPSRRSL